MGAETKGNLILLYNNWEELGKVDLFKQFILEFFFCIPFIPDILTIPSTLLSWRICGPETLFLIFWIFQLFCLALLLRILRLQSKFPLFLIFSLFHPYSSLGECVDLNLYSVYSGYSNYSAWSLDSDLWDFNQIPLIPDILTIPSTLLSRRMSGPESLFCIFCIFPLFCLVLRLRNLRLQSKSPYSRYSHYSNHTLV